MKHQYQVLVFHREGLLVAYGLFRQNRIDCCFGPLVSAATARAHSAARTGHRVYHDGVASVRRALRQGLLGAPTATGNRLQILDFVGDYCEEAAQASTSEEKAEAIDGAFAALQTEQKSDDARAEARRHVLLLAEG